MDTLKKFKAEVLEELRKKFEDSELDTINVLLEGKTKVNSVKKIHLETFRKMINLLSQGLDWSEDETISEEEKKKKKIVLKRWEKVSQKRKYASF